MWLNSEAISQLAIHNYHLAISGNMPRFVVIDSLFDSKILDDVVQELRSTEHWRTQHHSYSELYLNSKEWQSVEPEQQFVKRDLWQRQENEDSVATGFLQFLRSTEFLEFVSKVFAVKLTDVNLLNAEINSNYFRLAKCDFVNQHADESPGREVCMLLYLNQDWKEKMGGELCFRGQKFGEPVSIAPLFNRCVLFDPASPGAEHWVHSVNASFPGCYRFNVTSWYWSE
jgi:SM-20-related protein